MTVIDIILGALILFGFIRGLMKGLFVEVASLIALIAGVYGAIHFSNFAAEFLMEHVDWNEKTINIIAFAITFIIIVLVISLAGKALTKLANFAALGLLNKVLGGAFGGLKIAMILSIILMIFAEMNATLPFVSQEDLEGAVLYKPVKSIAPMVLPNFLGSSNDDTTQTNQNSTKEND
ncbi:MAG: CvpA family protein [Flavobacteriaceae bacterium]|nr:CvpA family protein [Flavobacteriaceae bacterium]